MPSDKRRPLISGNWKMNLNHYEAIHLIQKLSYLLPKDALEDVDVSVHPPFTDIRSVQTVIESDSLGFLLGAQNCHPEEKGAFTGEVSPAFLAKLGVRLVICGHSERRQLFGETDEFVAAKVASITGVPAAIVTELAAAYGKAAAPFIRQGSGLYRYGNGAMTARLISCLPALVGAYAKPGGGTLGDLSTGSAFETSIITREDFLDKPTRTVNINQLGDALNGGVSDPPIMGLYVYHSNPASVYPDQNSILRGLSREDLFTVVHERFMTDTALYADIVLPATTSAEHDDVYRSYGHYGLQRVKACISPVADAKSNWDTFCLLAGEMGLDEPFFRQSAAELLDQLFEKPGNWLNQVDLQRLRAGEAVTLPLPENYKMQFRTASGRIEIVNPRETPALPDWFPPYGGKGELFLMTAPSLYSLYSSFNESAELVAT